MFTTMGRRWFRPWPVALHIRIGAETSAMGCHIERDACTPHAIPPGSGSNRRMRFVSPRERVTPSSFVLMRDHRVVIRAKKRRAFAADRWQSEESQRRHIVGVPLAFTTFTQGTNERPQFGSSAIRSFSPDIQPFVAGSLRTATLRRVHRAKNGPCEHRRSIICARRTSGAVELERRSL